MLGKITLEEEEEEQIINDLTYLFPRETKQGNRQYWNWQTLDLEL